MRWKKAWVATDWNGTMGGYEMKLCWMLFWVDCLYPAWNARYKHGRIKASAKRNGMWVDLGCGMRKPLMLCGAEVGEMNWTQWSEGWMAVRHELPPPKRNERSEWTDRKHRVIKIYLFFDTATTNGWWGNLEVFGQRSGAKALNFVRLLYIIRLYLSPIYRRRRGIEYNFMLCILALSCFFSGANQVRWWRLEYLMSFLPVAGLAYWFFWGTRKSNVPIVGWLQKVWQKKNNSRVDCAEADKKTVQAMWYEGRGFLAAGDSALRSCP